MKLSTANLIGSIFTTIIWAALLILSVLPFTNGLILSIIGLGVISMWMTNAVGSIIGIVTIIRQVDSPKSWFGFGLHLIQFSVITAITILGILVGN